MEIEIFSDVICPWCFIGKQRLDRALPGDVGEGITLRWRPYQLFPGLPAEGLDRGEYLRRRYGEDADSTRAPRRITEEAEGEGLTLRYDLIQRLPNTLLAHRLLEYAYVEGVQHRLSEILFQAYFCAGEDVGEADTLARLGARAGLDADAVANMLASDAYAQEVAEQLARAPEVGVSGVPGYLLAGGFLLPGAQSTETMAQIITRAKLRLG
ncbi:MAG: DsbA family oxidoreductase [Pseudomonadota bacterium]